jgi:hypothetical protein
MKSEKPFRRINDLVADLSKVSTELGSGTLHLEGLETACDDARELYERLVVLRHKAREATTGAGKSAPTSNNKLREAPPSTEAPSEQPSLRLDTRPAPEVPSRQTSLIEAIEHTEQQKAEPSTGKLQAQAPSLAEKLEKAAVSDLNKAITLSHKFWFVAELFNGDRQAYEKGVERLNGFANIGEANAFIQEEVMSKLKKPADPEALATFNELVQRRYA